MWCTEVVYGTGQRLSPRNGRELDIAESAVATSSARDSFSPLRSHPPRDPLTSPQPLTLPMAETAVFIKKKGKGRPGGIRERAVEETGPTASETESTSSVVHAAKKAVANHLVQGTNPLKRRRAEDPNLALALSDSDDDKDQDKVGVRHSAGTSRPRRRSSSPPAEMSAPFVKPKEDQDQVKDDGIYRGAAGQAHKLPKAFGPVKGGPGNVRSVPLLLSVRVRASADRERAGRSPSSTTSQTSARTTRVRLLPFSCPTERTSDNALHRDRLLRLRRQYARPSLRPSPSKRADPPLPS